MLRDKLPCDEKLESCIIALMLRDKKIAEYHSPNLDEECFTQNDMRAIYSAIRSVLSRSLIPDIPIIATELDAAGWLEKIGGHGVLKAYAKNALDDQNCSEIVDELQDLSLRRKIIIEAQRADERARDPKSVPVEVVDQTAGALVELSRVKANEGPRQVKEINKELFKRIQDRYENGVTGVTTGLVDLDNKIVCLEKGTLTLVAARTGVGKSTLATSIVPHMAKKYGHVVMFSLEMSKEQTLSRIISAHACISSTRMRTGKGMQPQDWNKLAKGMEEIGQLRISIDSRSAITPMYIRAQSRRAKDRFGLAVIIVDHIQLMRSDNGFDKEYDRLSSITWALKAISMDLDVPIMALCQLNRSGKERKDKRPTLTDLRGSGTLEQDADLVIGIYRESTDEGQNNNTKNREDTELIILKHREGETGVVEVTWIPEWVAFKNKYHGNQQ
jgi:replicative DNA helicase